MSIKNILKATGITYAKYSNLFLAYSLASGIILFASYYLTTIFNFEILSMFITLLIFIPILTSFKFVSLAAVDRKDIENKHFYFGFKNYFFGTAILSNSMISTLVSIVLGTLLGLLIGSLVLTLMVMYKNPTIVSDFLSTNDYEALLSKVSSLSYYDSMALVTSIISIVFGGISYFVFGTKNLFAPFINLDTGFTPTGASKISKKFVKKNNRSFIGLNALFVLIEFVIIALVIILNRIFMYFEFHSLVINLITSLFFFISNGILLPIYELSLSHAYVHYLRKEAKDTYDKYKEAYNQHFNL